MLGCSKYTVDASDLGNQRGIGNGEAEVETDSTSVAGDGGGFTEKNNSRYIRKNDP